MFRFPFKLLRKLRFLQWALIAWYLNCLPLNLFNDPNSTVLLDKDGKLLCAKIADDGQWRFPSGQKVPEKFEICLLQFEDRNFYEHYGISLRGLGRAVKQNFSAGKVVSGGSTITMQLARIMRKNPPRTITEKLMEMAIATRIEMRYSKEEILNMYAGNAPMGSNVVGLDAAAWRYFGRSAEQLSWAESATLAVLPNAPGLIHPGKNRKRLLEKRNRLLHRLYEIKVIDFETYALSIEEPLPEKPLPLEQLAPHLLTRAINEGYKGKILKTTLAENLQKQTTAILETHHEHLKQNEIHNGAILVISVKTGHVIAYTGNTKPGNEEADNGNDVDIITSPRSTGSTLKPFLYAKMIDEGKLMPKQLLPDIPTQIGGYNPKNFSPDYDGAIPANTALSRSLNIPAVRMLNDYGVEKFRRDLNKFGFTTMKRSSAHYGLSLILGGAEAKLWDLCRAYRGMAQVLNSDQHKLRKQFSDPVYISEINYRRNRKEKKQVAKEVNEEPALISRAAIWHTFEAMVEVNRPDEEGNWRAFESSQKIAWKTGTSFGFRDAWAVGITPEYVVGVWVGNADGEGRPGLTGIKCAAPILFDVFNILPKTKWFSTPKDDMIKLPVCRTSGLRAGENCTDADTVHIAKTCLNTTGCTYHQLIHLDKTGRYRVNADCEEISSMKSVKWFVLPAVIEKFYKFNNPGYKVLPDYRCDCVQEENKDKSVAVIYPRKNSKIYLPVTFDGTTGKTVFEATHRVSSSRLFWHLDDVYIGETRDIHQLEFNPGVGKHKLLITDEAGRTAGVSFEVIGGN